MTTTDDTLFEEEWLKELRLAEQAPFGPMFGALGVTAAASLAAAGAALGTAKSAMGITGAAMARPDNVTRSLVPVIMAGIVAIYGLVVGVILSGKVRSSSEGYTLQDGFSHMAAGLVCGICGLSAGYAIGAVGEAGVRGLAQQPKLFVVMVLMLIFAEVLGLYGLIVALILAS